MNGIQEMGKKIINRWVLIRFAGNPMSIKHPKVVAVRAACATGAHEALFNLLT